MAVTLKDETIVNQWSQMISGGAGRGPELLATFRSALERAAIPPEWSMKLEEVKSKGWFSRERREMLIIKVKQFSDYKVYISARDYGVEYLDVCRFVTVEPGFFKRRLASKAAELSGMGPMASFLSTPKNILEEADLEAFITVVHDCLVKSAAVVLESLGQDPGQIRRQSKGVLEVW